MYKNISKLVVAVLFIFSGSAAIGSPNIKEGLWKVTAKIELPGIPMAIPPAVKTECLDKNRLIPKIGKVENCHDCKIIKVDIKDNTVKWHEECDSPEGKVIVDGEIVYSGDSYKGTIQIKQGNTRMVNKISGKYIGPCK